MTTTDNQPRNLHDPHLAMRWVMLTVFLIAFLVALAALHTLRKVQPL